MDGQLRRLVEALGPRWRLIAQRMGLRRKQVYWRWEKVLRSTQRSGPWSVAEDLLLLTSIARLGLRWELVAKVLPGRNPRQCRERWVDHLDPRVKRAPFDADELGRLRELVETQQATYGGRVKWVEVARQLGGRTDAAVKNAWKCERAGRGACGLAALRALVKRACVLGARELFGAWGTLLKPP
ncbi:MAG: Homeodomain-like protein [Monoraphidium minutum]|nr:MAG: Homeodomain-like protein [Monoraphidium minutum]